MAFLVSKFILESKLCRIHPSTLQSIEKKQQMQAEKPTISAKLINSVITKVVSNLYIK